MNNYTFSGSYRPEDVIFLLKPIAIKPTNTAEKERRIQTGQSHYSEMIGKEKLPSADYLRVFIEGFERNEQKLAENVIKLANILAKRCEGEITIVSLARAGTPIGVLLKRTLTRFFGKSATHYSVSIIRDRGLDENALLYILKQGGHSPASIVFVDGWTGKGVIARELKKSVCAFNKHHGVELEDKLYVLTDLCGQADVAPSCEDYLISSSVLNATVSGLVSRSILNSDYIGKNDFHGCVYYEQFEDHDLSNWFVDRVTAKINEIDQQGGVGSIPAQPLSDEVKKKLKDESEAFVRYAIENHNVKNINYIKPGIGEATRVLMRRVPDKLILKDPQHDDVQHLIVLACEKKVPVAIDQSLPYNAAAFIQNLKI